MEVNRVILGKNIRNIRCHQKLEVRELAERADISTKFLYEIEAGKKGISYKTLYCLASALCVTTDFLITGKTGNTNEELVNVVGQLNGKEQELLFAIATDILELRNSKAK